MLTCNLGEPGLILKRTAASQPQNSSRLHSPARQPETRLQFRDPSWGGAECAALAQLFLAQLLRHEEVTLSLTSEHQQSVLNGARQPYLGARQATVHPAEGLLALWSFLPGPGLMGRGSDTRNTDSAWVRLVSRGHTELP